MVEATLIIELLSDLAIPAESRTIGHPSTRDHIPGRLLLGAAASRIHDTLSADDAWRIFQTAAVRFLDGLPLSGDTRSIPVPRSLHHRKSDSDQTVYNLANEAGAQAARANHGQAEALKSGHVTPDLAQWAFVKTETSLRTAVGDAGRAAHGLLYSMDVIRRGAVFAARIIAEQQSDLDVVCMALAGTRLLGRSRSAELGRVRITVRATTSNHPTPPQSATTLSFLAVSPLALRDAATGMPTFLPTASHFGLPAGWSFDPQWSFIRTERFSPFHGKRNLPDLERHVIARGSVITFSAKQQIPVSDLSEAHVRGVGDYTHQGFGEVLWLSVLSENASLPLPPKAPKTSLENRNTARAPSDTLFEWLSAQENAKRSQGQVISSARTSAGAFGRWNINKAQWGTIRAMARAARLSGNSDKFVHQLDAYLAEGVRKLEKNWGRRVGKDTAREVLINTIRAEAAAGHDPTAFAETLAELVVRQKKGARQEGDRS